MNSWQTWIAMIALVFTASLSLSSCSTEATQVEHYVSPKIEGEAQKINLDEVQKAFFDSKGKDFNSWMGAFEKRVNEIYDGKEIVSLDATRKEGKLSVTGFISKDNKETKEGFQPGDEKLFTIEQTGEAVNNEMPYRVTGSNDRPYYEGHRSILDNPFLQMMLISHFMGGGWGGRYYTPPSRVVILHDSRDSFRSSPDFSQQQSRNQGFFSRWKSNPQGQLQSNKSFGDTNFSSANTSSKRGWFGGSSAGTSGGSSSSGSALGGTSSSGSLSGSSSTLGSGSSSSSSGSSGSSWGGRRSSGSGLFGGSSRTTSRSWGGFRRR